MALKNKFLDWLKKKGRPIGDGLKEISLGSLASQILSIPGATWDFLNPSDFTEEEKQQVEMLLTKYGVKVSLTDLDNETEVFMKLNQFLDDLSENQKESFLEELVGILDTY